MVTRREASGLRGLEAPGLVTVTAVLFAHLLGPLLDNAAYPLSLLLALSLWTALFVCRPGRPAGRTAPPLLPLLVVAGLALYAFGTLLGNARHDPWCHHNIVNTLARQGFPLTAPGLPELPLDYHFGVDTLAAGLRLLPFVEGTEAALDLASLWGVLCALWAAIAVWQRWRVSRLAMVLGLLLLVLSPGLLRWADLFSSLPYETLDVEGAVPEGGSYLAFVLLLGRRASVFGALLLFLLAGLVRDLIRSDQPGPFPWRSVVALGLRSGVVFGGAILWASDIAPVAALGVAAALVLAPRERRLRDRVFVALVALLPSVLGLLSGGFFSAFLLGNAGGEGAALGFHIVPNMPSFLPGVDLRASSGPFWEVLLWEFGPLALVPVFLLLRRLGGDRRYGVVAFAIPAAAWGATLFLELPAHGAYVDLHRFAVAAQLWAFLHAPILVAILVRGERLSWAAGHLGFAVVVLLYLPSRLVPAGDELAAWARPELLVLCALPLAWRGERPGEVRRSSLAWTVVGVLALGPLVAGVLALRSVGGGGAFPEQPVLGSLVPELAASPREPVLAAPALTELLLVEGWAVAEAWDSGGGDGLTAVPEGGAVLRPRPGLRYALLSASELAEARATWPSAGFSLAWERRLDALAEEVGCYEWLKLPDEPIWFVALQPK